MRDETVLAGRAVGDAGDAIANDYLSRSLQLLRPRDSILSEESADDARRLRADRTWIIDPLDGTREFSEGRADWAVHVALVKDGQPIVAAVALPTLGVCSSELPPPTVEPAERVLRIAVSRSRPPAEATRVATSLDAELVPLGSAGYKAMAVVHGEVDAYIHAGGQYQWDSAAPVGVARAAGLHCSRIDGSPLTYNEPDLSLPDLIVCRHDIAKMLLDALSHRGSESA